MLSKVLKQPVIILSRQPYIPLLGAMASTKILQVINDGDALGLDSPEEVVLDRVLAAQTLVLNDSPNRAFELHGRQERHTSCRRRP
jgi:hypothetical protein